MIVYWSACLTSIVFTWIATHIKHNPKREGVLYWIFITFFSSFPLIYIAAIRYNVGADYATYYRYYNSILNGGEQGRFEILFYLINKSVAAFHGSVVLMFGLTATLFLLPIYKRIIKDSPYPYMSIFLLLAMTYYFYFLNGTRQMIGAAFLLLSIPYIEKKKWLPFVILTLIAAGFHTTSLVFLAFYFLIRFNLTPKILAIVTAGVFIFGQAFGNLANNIISHMDYYSSYLDSAFVTARQGYVVLTMNIVLVVFSTIFYQKNNPKFKIYYTLQVVALWASALTGKVVLIDRFRMVFGLASIILVPMTISGIGDRKTRRICAILIEGLYFLYATYTVGLQNSNSVLPYQTVYSSIM